MEIEIYAERQRCGLGGYMDLLQISEERNEVQKQMKSIVGDMPVPYSLAQRWIETERAYQIKLANIEATNQARIIKEQAKTIEDLRRGIRA